MLRNRAAWDSFAKGFVELGQRAWSSVDAYWGIWGVPEREVGLLEASTASTRSNSAVAAATSPRGCCVVAPARSAWTTHRTSSPLPSSFQEEFSVSFPLVQGDAEHAPFPDESFDLVMSEYGAAIGCDPTAGYPRPRACSARAVASASWGTHRSPCFARPTARTSSRAPTDWCAISSACIDSTGRTPPISRFPTAR